MNNKLDPWSLTPLVEQVIGPRNWKLINPYSIRVPDGLMYKMFGTRSISGKITAPRGFIHDGRSSPLGIFLPPAGWIKPAATIHDLLYNSEQELQRLKIEYMKLLSDEPIYENGYYNHSNNFRTELENCIANLNQVVRMWDRKKSDDLFFEHHKATVKNNNLILGNPKDIRLSHFVSRWASWPTLRVFGGLHWQKGTK